MTAPAIKYATHADSGGNWYCPKERRQVVEVIGANGKPRKPTLRDARENGWWPGVTTIVKCAAAPGLERWKIGTAIMESLTNTRRPDETDEQWIDRLMEASGDTARKAAEAGTAIHAKVQQFLESGQHDNDPHVLAVRNVLENVCGRDMEWHTERLCFHRSGFGTKSDVAAKDGSWVWDLKSSEFTSAGRGDLRTYPTHWMQLAATREALAQDDDRFYTARCGILYVSRKEPGTAHPVEVKEHELTKGKGMFDALLRYWILDRGYQPGECNGNAR